MDVLNGVSIYFTRIMSGFLGQLQSVMKDAHS
jgi:hypothetical protein